MKKQGPPEPLDESKILGLKRSKSFDDRETVRAEKKRRTELATGKQNKGKKGDIRNRESQGKNQPELSGRKVVKTQAARALEPEPEDKEDESDALPGDDFDELNGNTSEEAEYGGIDGAPEKLGDKFDAFSTSSNEEQDDEMKSAFDSGEEDQAANMFSDDEEDDEGLQKLTAANMEGLSRKLDLQTEQEQQEAKADMRESALQTNIAGDEEPAMEGDDMDAMARAKLAPDLRLLRNRISDTIRILDDFSRLAQPGKSRAEYRQQFIDDISLYYGYTPYLAEKLANLFSPREAFAFFEANESPRPIVIRTNTLRTNRRSLAQALINRGVVLEPVGKWSKVGLQVFESAVPLGATPEYLAGHYILQAASSFLPVMALAPQPHERVLDMAAAPGGKTTYVSALMQNTGCVLANDASKSRAKGLIGNIHRLGCKNTIVSNLNAQTAFPKAIGGFDRVLLDAPCSGTGVISKDPSVKTSKAERDFMTLPHMQRLLLLAAIDSINHNSKTGGYVVYSTCSVTVEENEAVVQYALRKRPNVKIVDTGLGNFGSEGLKSFMGNQFDTKMTYARRYFPHRENVDGFFVCKLKKIGPSPKPAPDTAIPQNGETLEVVEADKTLVGNVSDVGDDDNFGGFDNSEDEILIERAKRRQLRKKGVNPRSQSISEVKIKNKELGNKSSKKTNKALNESSQKAIQ